MTERDGTEGRAGANAASPEGSTQRALDAASSEPRTLAADEQQDRAAALDERETAEQTVGPAPAVNDPT
jgi:hypothetical protein